ncbi:DUF7507 domain-containing protein [Agromyces subbeticus]|uniref:DUF7507 domain-containing protein n=1 Tax=Agromyces subbeticus TaxID=293890 RepID=UPI00146A1933|nr:DUF11 domain-containing protein [Agromyces subbeticus]
MAGATSAQATTNYPGSRLMLDQTFYVYVEAGEVPYYNFTQFAGDPNQAADFTITDPTGVVQQTCHFNAGSPNGSACVATGLASIPGVWAIKYEDNEIVANTTNWNWNWEVEARTAANVEIPGRTWVERYGQNQAGATNQSLWIATPEGYLYGVLLVAYNGLGSYFESNGFGLVDAGTCTPIYKSVEGTVFGANGVFIDPRYDYSDACGDAYKIFLDAPAADLPANAPSAQGMEWIRPTAIAPAATNLTLIPNSPFTRAGQIEFDLAGVNGGYSIEIDADNNGSYDDAADRTIPWGSPPGHITVPFDGLDGAGQPMDVCAPFSTRVVVDRVGEMHLVLQDVERLGNVNSASGIRVTGLTPGVTAPNPKVYWDDRDLAPRGTQAVLPYADGRSGVDTSTLTSGFGTHGWPQPWGDLRSIENWTYYEAQAGDETRIEAACAPGLSIDKESELNDTNANGAADVGETIDYTFLVRNTGNAPLTDVTVDDSLVAGVTPEPVDLPVFGEQLFTSTPYVVTQADVDAGGVTNIATAIGLGPDEDPVVSEEDTEFVPTPPREPAITLDKQAELNDTNGNGVADLGETIDYTFTVENTGNVTVTDATIVDDLVSGISASVTLAPGETNVFTADPYVVTQADLNTGSVNNSAIADAVSPIGPVESNTDTTKVLTPVPDPLLTLEKSGEITIDVNGNGLADVGDTVHYFFVTHNEGTVDLTGVTINDPKVGTTTPASIDVEANTNAFFEADYVTTQADVDAGALLNTATASGIYLSVDGPVDVVSGPANAVIPTPELAPSLSIEKDGALDDTNTNGVADVGETITYTFEVTNNGNTTLLGVNVIDDRVASVLPAGTDLLPTATATFTASPYTVTQADVDAGEVLNTAFARGHVPNGTEVFSSVDEHVEDVVAADPSLAINKTAELDDTNNNGTADAGETIVYTFGVQNTGNVTLYDVVVNDALIAELLPEPIDYLPPAAIYIFVASPYSVTAEDVAAGEIVNVATATGTTATDQPVESNEDTATVLATSPATPPAPPVTPGGGLAQLGATGIEALPFWATALALLLVGGIGVATARRHRMANTTSR